MPSLSNPVKAVFFDLGWTLVYPPSGDWEFTEPAKKLFRWDVYATLPEERRVQGRKAAYDTFRPRHKNGHAGGGVPAEPGLLRGNRQAVPRAGSHPPGRGDGRAGEGVPGPPHLPAV